MSLNLLSSCLNFLELRNVPPHPAKTLVFNTYLLDFYFLVKMIINSKADHYLLTFKIKSKLTERFFFSPPTVLENSRLVWQMQ